MTNPATTAAEVSSRREARGAADPLNRLRDRNAAAIAAGAEPVVAQLPRWNDGQAEDPREGRYYATARSEGGRKTAFLCGPYATHGEALDKVRPAKRLVEERCSWRSTAGASYGTARLPLDAEELPTTMFAKEEVR